MYTVEVVLKCRIAIWSPCSNFMLLSLASFANPIFTMAIQSELTFPTEKSQFNTDDRISFSKLDDKYIAVHDDGDEYEFDEERKLWVLCDEDEEAPHLEADEVNLGSSAPQASRADPHDTSDNGRKRKGAPSADDNDEVSSVCRHWPPDANCDISYLFFAGDA